MNIKVVVLLVLLIGGAGIFFVLCSKISSNPPGAGAPTSSNPNARTPPANSPTPTWVDTVLNNPPDGWNDSDRFQAMIHSIEADPYRVSRLDRIISETSYIKELYFIEEILSSLASQSAEPDYIGLAQAVEIRSSALGTPIYPVMVFERYTYDEVQEFMMPILMDDSMDTTDRTAVARWLRAAWERKPFPDALRENKGQFFSILDSCQNKKIADPRERSFNQMFFFDLLLSLLKCGAIDCDEAINRLEVNMRVVPESNGSDDWRVKEIHQVCG